VGSLSRTAFSGIVCLISRYGLVVCLPQSNTGFTRPRGGIPVALGSEQQRKKVPRTDALRVELERGADGVDGGINRAGRRVRVREVVEGIT
jgi:hypothetical protein